MISRNTITAVFDQLDIVDVAEKLVTDLKKSGSGYKAKSPFANEKSPSFFVVPSKQIFKCFSSGRGGNAVTLVMEIEKLTYPEAIEWLANHYKIPVEYDNEQQTPEEKEEALEQEKKVNSLMRASLRKWKESADNTPVFDAWCTERGITKDDVAQWGIAFAPDEWRYLTPHIVDNALMTLADEIGVAKHKDGKNFDVYRNRIIFPIHDLRGKLVGFAGRILPRETMLQDTEPKYINPKESFLYDKSRVLYGWHFAAQTIRKTGVCRLVEGYVDVIALHRADVTNAVAPCGTAVTIEQATTIAKSASVVDIIFDGDKAGIKAARRAIDIFIPTGIEVRVCTLPNGKDPDNLVMEQTAKLEGLTDRTLNELVEDELSTFTCDAILWILESADGTMGAAAKGKFAEELAELLSKVVKDVVREEYINTVSKALKINKKTFTKQVNDCIEKAQRREAAAKQKEAAKAAQSQFDVLDEGEWFPEWAMPMAKEIKRNLIVQRTEGDEWYPTGIYFPPVKNNSPVFVGLERVTNYCVNPRFQILHETNGRWMVEVWNGKETNTVELTDGALVAPDQFAKSMIAKRCYQTPKFQKFHYTMIMQHIVDNSMKCFELGTLGYQPDSDEDFMAFSNAVMIPDADGVKIERFNELGIVTVRKKNFYSPGVSSVRSEYRQEDSFYENDRYLQYVESPITFSEWARLYCEVYDDHGPYGVAFALLSIYKDFIYRIGAKCPLLYLYGPKGSGKSAMGESLMNLFFSGKNADGRLIQAVNMTPNMITPFALSSALSRFANCPRLYNEYDPMLTDAQYRGWFKGAFDGEGRERGVGESGSKRKTEVMKIKGTLMLAGQYMDTADDGALMTRSINLQFSEEKNKNRSEAQKGKWQQLNDLEKQGLSGALGELIAIRPFVAEQLRARFFEIKRRMGKDAQKLRGSTVEERLINNYALCYTFCEIVDEKIRLPFKALDFYNDCIDRMVRLSSQVNEGGLLFKFWKVVESLVETGKIKYGDYLLVRQTQEISIRENGNDNGRKSLGAPVEVIWIRFSEIYAAYSKEVKDRGQKAMSDDIILSYMKDQPYFYGLTPKVNFASRQTSAYALNNEMLADLGIQLTPSEHRSAGSRPADTPVAADNTPSDEFSKMEDEDTIF